MQLDVVDGVVSVHDLTVFAPITVLEKARGATLFALDLQAGLSLINFSVNDD